MKTIRISPRWMVAIAVILGVEMSAYAQLGGLINIEQLTNKINDLVNTFNSHTHNVTVSHPGGTFTTVKPGSSASSFKKGDYEDEKIKH